MTPRLSIDSLFEEQSIEDIESIRDNLAKEIEKRTEQLKTIVKGKYRDIVETSDAILAMQDKLGEIETSIKCMDESTGKFFTRVRESNTSDQMDAPKREDEDHSNRVSSDGRDLVRELIHHSSQVRVHSGDNNNLLTSLDSLNTCFDILHKNHGKFTQEAHLIAGIKTGLNRSREMLKKSLWYTILRSAPDSVGVIAKKGESSIFELSMDAALGFLTADLCDAISDMSHQAQLRRYQPQVAFNTSTNEIELEIHEADVNLSTHVLIPKLISPELSHYLFRVCKAINTISGSNRDLACVVYSLKATICNILLVYQEILPIAGSLRGDNKRRRCLQLYFDLLYVRTILNSSKCLELMECLDPQISELSQRYETLVDPVELFMISRGIQKNVINLGQTTIRLYGLLIPHLE